MAGQAAFPGDQELYWESDDFGEPNTISGGIGAVEMLRFDDVGPALAMTEGAG